MERRASSRGAPRVERQYSVRCLVARTFLCHVVLSKARLFALAWQTLEMLGQGRGSGLFRGDQLLHSDVYALFSGRSPRFKWLGATPALTSSTRIKISLHSWTHGLEDMEGIIHMGRALMVQHLPPNYDSVHWDRTHDLSTAPCRGASP